MERPKGDDGGAISRRMVKVAGMRGHGAVHYSLNPWVGTHLGKEARAKVQAVTPRPAVRGGGSLKLVEPTD